MESVRLTEGAAATVERDVLGKIRLTSSSNRSVSVQVTLVVLVALTVVTFLRMATARSTSSRPRARRLPTSGP